MIGLAEKYRLNVAVKFLRPVGAPDRVSRLRVQSGDKLDIRALEVHDEQIIKQNRRGNRALHMLTVQIGPTPQHLTRSRIETGCSMGAIMYVYKALFHHGRRCCIRIVRVNSLGPVRMKNLYIMDDSAAIQINANGV